VALPPDERESFRRSCRDLLKRSATSARLREHAGEDGAAPDAELWRQAVEQGWTAIGLPEAHGGADGDLRDLAIAVGESAETLQLAALAGTTAATRVLGRHGALDQRPELAAAFAEGAVVSFGHGLDLVGDRTLSLDGPVTVPLVAAADVAAYIVCAGRRDGVFGLAVVDLASAQRTPRRVIDLTRAFGDVSFAPDAVVAFVPGADAGQDLFHAAVALQAAESLGVATRLVEMTVAHAGTREQFGRPIGGFQAIKHRLAEMHVELECSRVAVPALLESLDLGSSDRITALHATASCVGRATSWIASQALQIHGGIGFTWEHDLHLYLRRAKADELLLGVPDWHELALADQLAGAAPA
jgi:alkylation response protein AidB-like acyl-CoA dehydrogenase